MVIAGPDAHGVSLAAARARILSQQGENVEIYARFPDTLPRNAAQTFARLAQEYEAVNGTEVLDIPVNVEQPHAFIEALAKLPAPVVLYDHHETSVPFAQEMVRRGVTPVIVGDGVQLLTALEIPKDNDAFRLGLVGVVADRDRSVLRVVPREQVERELLPLANTMDIVVRNPRLVGAEDQAGVAKRLAEDPGLLERLSQQVDWPPARIAQEVRVLEEGEYALLADFTSLDPARTSMWVPKTMEQLAINHGKDYVIAVVPGWDARNRRVVGYDVRVIKYWLSDAPATAEELLRDVIQRMAPQGRVVGHADYVSVRFNTVEEARRVAEEVYKRAEATQPWASHFISDKYVAAAIRHDYRQMVSMYREIVETLRGIREALERGAAAKEEQVRLLRRAVAQGERDVVLRD